MSNFLSDDIQQYCSSHSGSDSPLLAELTDYTHNNVEHSSMLCGPDVGSVLQLYLKILGAERILEIGTFTGYSALKMAQVLGETGSVHTCEMDENHAAIAQSFFDRSEYGSKITLYIGAALETLRVFEESSFDFAFIDADKENYPHYYKRTLQLIRPGGIIVLDNMLWGGEVLHPVDDDSKALRETGNLIQNDTSVDNLLLPVRDGLMVCRKK